MYAKQIYVENNGPIKQIQIEFPFDLNGIPKPMIIVGGNGSGKTNLLSIVADALFEAAATHYTDVAPFTSGGTRPWLRIVGATTILAGAPGSVVAIEFEHEGQSHYFREKSGKLNAADVSTRVPESLRSAIAWADDANAVKIFSIPEAEAHKAFETGVYAYFPAHRYEIPHWLNRNSVPLSGFDLTQRFAKQLGKPIYVEQSLEKFHQWLLTIILESRHDAITVPTVDGDAPIFQIVGPIGRAVYAGLILGLANQILSLILDDVSARFVWMGRSIAKIGIARGDQISVPGLEALSSGQSTLLSIFGTILRYADNETQFGFIIPGNITGLCIIDGIDAHMHIDLQRRALPALGRAVNWRGSVVA